MNDGRRWPIRYFVVAGVVLCVILTSFALLLFKLDRNLSPPASFLASFDIDLIDLYERKHTTKSASAVKAECREAIDEWIQWNLHQAKWRARFDRGSPDADESGFALRLREFSESGTPIPQSYVLFLIREDRVLCDLQARDETSLWRYYTRPSTPRDKAMHEMLIERGCLD